MKKNAYFVVVTIFLIVTGFFFSRAQGRPNQLTTAKTSQVQEIDLLKRIQVLEKELAELKNVIEINGPSVRIKAQGSINIESQGAMTLKTGGAMKTQSSQLDLISGRTRAANMQGTISLVIGPLQGASPVGAVIVSQCPVSSPFVIK